MKISPFRRRAAVPSLASVLANYLVRAQAIADAGGGDLWVVEPSLSPELLPEIAEAVLRCLADYGIPTAGVTGLDGTASARIRVVAATADADAGLPPRDAGPPVQVALPAAHEPAAL